MLHVSGSQLVVLLALSVVWAFLGYRLSEMDRRNLGRTPWGLPSLLWAFFWFLSLLLGLVLYLIAHFSGLRRAQQNPPVMGLPGPTPMPPMSEASASRKAPSASELFPAYPRPANSQPEQAEVTPEDVVEASSFPSPGAPVQPGTQGVGNSSPPAWQPDPSGRFHYRWWDGTQWTSQVSTDGHHLIDTNPDQRIGPY